MFRSGHKAPNAADRPGSASAALELQRDEGQSHEKTKSCPSQSDFCEKEVGQVFFNLAFTNGLHNAVP